MPIADLVDRSIEGENALREAGKTRIHLSYSTRSPAASFHRSLGPLYGDCAPTVQPSQTRLQVREGRILQGNQEQMRSPKLPLNPKKEIKTILHQFRNKNAR